MSILRSRLPTPRSRFSVIGSAILRRWRWIACVAAFILLPVIGLPVLAKPCPSDATSEWAAALDGRDISDRLARLGELPVEYRKALLKRASPAQRLAVWRSSLAAARMEYKSRLDQTALRSALLDRVDGLLTEEQFARPHTDTREIDRLRQLVKDVEQAFNRDFAILIFSSPGGTLHHRTSALSTRDRITHYRIHLASSVPSLLSGLRARWATGSTLHAKSVDPCECSVTYGACLLPPHYNWNCRVPEEGCNTSDDGCGPLGWLQCNGECWLPA
jgi:hypothetical protein